MQCVLIKPTSLSPVQFNVSVIHLTFLYPTSCALFVFFLASQMLNKNEVGACESHPCEELLVTGDARERQRLAHAAVVALHLAHTGSTK